MADDPLAGYSPTPDPLQGYEPTSAPSGGLIGTDKPADMPWSTYLAQRTTKALSSAVPGVSFDPRTNANEMLLLGKGLSGGTSGFIPGVREANAQAEAQTPLAERVGLEGAGYAAGPGMLGLGARGAGMLAPKVGETLARILGAGGEGALASGVGKAGEGGSPSEIARATGTGALLSGLVGTLPTARAAPNTPDTAALDAVAEGKWNNQVATEPVDPRIFRNTLAKANQAIDPAKIPLMGGVKGAVNDVMMQAGGMNTMNAGQVADFQRALMESARTPTQMKIAGDLKDALVQAYTPQAAKAVEGAKLATNVAKSSGELDALLADPAKAPAAAKALLKSDFYKNRPEFQDALLQISKMDQSPSLAGNIGGRMVKTAGRMAAGAAAHMLSGGNPFIGAMLNVMHAPITDQVATAAKTASIRDALLAAQHLNAAGVKLPSSAFKPPPSSSLTNFRDLARYGILGASAGGNLPNF